MRIKQVVVILITGLCLNLATAQDNNKQILIKGTVVDANNDGIMNAIVMIDGKRTNTLTNSKGNFRIKVNSSHSRIGIFTFGLGIIEEDIAGRTLINFNFETEPVNDPGSRTSGISIPLHQELPDGEQPVDVGYAVIKKKDLPVNISFIDGTKTKYQTYPTVIDMIIREVSGVRRYGTGVIIQNGANFLGPVPPLIIIDGMQGGRLDDISPIMVKSISVLKGTAAAIFGSRGYGGAIIIRTKYYNE